MATDTELPKIEIPELVIHEDPVKQSRKPPDNLPLERHHFKGDKKPTLLGSKLIVNDVTLHIEHAEKATIQYYEDEPKQKYPSGNQATRVKKALGSNRHEYVIKTIKRPRHDNSAPYTLEEWHKKVEPSLVSELMFYQTLYPNGPQPIIWRTKAGTEEEKLQIAIPRIAGIELHEALNIGALNTRKRCLATLQLGSQLLHLHRLGLLYPDLKPENIMIVQRSGKIGLIDGGSLLLHTDRYPVAEEKKPYGQASCTFVDTKRFYTPKHGVSAGKKIDISGPDSLWNCHTPGYLSYTYCFTVAGILESQLKLRLGSGKKFPSIELSFPPPRQPWMPLRKYLYNQLKLKRGERDDLETAIATIEDMILEAAKLDAERDLNPLLEEHIRSTVPNPHLSKAEIFSSSSTSLSAPGSGAGAGAGAGSARLTQARSPTPSTDSGSGDLVALLPSFDSKRKGIVTPGAPTLTPIPAKTPGAFSMTVSKTPGVWRHNSPSTSSTSASSTTPSSSLWSTVTAATATADPNRFDMQFDTLFPARAFESNITQAAHYNWFVEKERITNHSPSKPLDAQKLIRTMQTFADTAFARQFSTSWCCFDACGNRGKLRRDCELIRQRLAKFQADASYGTESGTRKVANPDTSSRTTTNLLK